LTLARGGVELFRRLSPGIVPRIDQVSLDPTVLAFAGALVVLVALVFGAAPALELARANPAAGVAASGRAGEGRGARRARGALLAVEVGLSLVLLVGAGLRLRSFASIYAVDPGFETRNVVRFTLSLPEARYRGLDVVSSFYRQLEERLAAVPGVEAVGSVYG